MGQTQSQKQQQPDLSQIYASYIQKQQDMIYQQQSQINSLYQHNLMNQHQMPPNMFFQNDINQHKSFRKSLSPTPYSRKNSKNEIV